MFEVEEDGIVGAWHRWVALGCASMTLGIMLGQFFAWFVGTFTHLPVHIYTWEILLVTIPLGVMVGEWNYQKDLRLNGPQSRVKPAAPKQFLTE